MVALVFILILFETLARCSATTTNIISLVASKENRLIMVDESDGPLPSLTLEKPFSIKIYSKICLFKLLCSKKQNLDKVHFSLGFKNDKSNANASYYFLESDVEATRAMKDMWRCKLFYSAEDTDDTIEFELHVDVILPPPGAQHTNEDAPKTRDGQNALSTPLKDNTAASDHKKNDKEVISDTNTMIVIAVVIGVIGLIAGVIIGIVWKKKCCRKRNKSVEEPVASPKGDTTEGSVYEELTPVDISKRPPYPLPPTEREENKRYIHYDTPYDHRFTRPVVPRKPQHLLRRL